MGVKTAGAGPLGAGHRDAHFVTGHCAQSLGLWSFSVCVRLQSKGDFFFLIKFESESLSVVSDSLRPHGLYSPWNSPGQNTGVRSLSLLQGIFPSPSDRTQVSHIAGRFFTS